MREEISSGMNELVEELEEMEWKEWKEVFNSMQNKFGFEGFLEDQRSYWKMENMKESLWKMKNENDF